MHHEAPVSTPAQFTRRDLSTAFPPDALVRWRQLKLLLPYNRSTVYRWERKGLFPKRIQLSANGRAWRLRDVLRWIDEKASQDTRAAAIGERG